MGATTMPGPCLLARRPNERVENRLAGNHSIECTVLVV